MSHCNSWAGSVLFSSNHLQIQTATATATAKWKKEKRKVTSWGHEDPWGRQVIGGLIDEMIGTSFCCCSSSCWARWCGSRDWPAPSRRRRDAPSVTSNRAASDATADPTRRRANPWRIELRYSVAGNWNITNNWIQLLDSIIGFN